MSRYSNYANFIKVTNQSAWECIEPVLNVPYTRPVKSVKKEKVRAEPSPKEKFAKIKGRKKDEMERKEIKNPHFSFTAFLIPLFVTGDKKDYQMLYCVCALKNGLKTVSTILRKEGFAQMYMVGIKSEVNWQQIKENNVTFADIIIEFLIKSGTVCMVAASKKEVISKVNNKDAPFVVLLTAADIHTPCQANLCVGTGWMIFRRSEESRKHLFDREVLNGGRRALHSGIVINGCNTIMICAFKEKGGVHYFIFDVLTGDFSLYDSGCYMRDNGNLLSVNEGHFYKFTTKVRDWLIEKKINKENLEYCSRYTGGWLTDGYKVLRSGGLLLSSEEGGFNEGRIKYICKAVPLAHLAEKAGGKASNGRASILKVKLEGSVSTNLVLGSIIDVDNYICKSFENQDTRGFAPSQDNTRQTDSDDTSTDID